MSGADRGYNLVGGEWKDTKTYVDLVDPLNGNNTLIRLPNTTVDEIQPFVESL